MRFVAKRWRSLLLVSAMGGMFAVVAQTAFAGPTSAPREADREAAARLEPVPGGGDDLRVDRPEGEWLGGLGIVEPARPAVRLSLTVSGRIARILVEEGERVEAGQTLLQLASATQQAALETAEAEVTVARSELRRARRGLRREDLEAITGDMEAARARAALSRGVLTRLEAASAAGGVTTDEIERARRQAEADASSVQSAEARVEAGRRGSPVDVQVAHAKLLAAIARRDEAQATLAERTLTAPLSGEILQVRFREGEYIEPGRDEAVVVMGDTSSLRARIDVDERDIARLEIGARAMVTVDALPGRRFPGRVVEVGRLMGRKNVRTDEPTERLDTKILEVVVDLGQQRALIVGQRVMGYLTPG